MQGLVVATANSCFSLVERVEDGSYKVSHCHAIDPETKLYAMLPLSEDSFVLLSGSGQLLKATTATGKNKVRLHCSWYLQHSVITTLRWYYTRRQMRC